MKKTNEDGSADIEIIRKVLTEDGFTPEEVGDNALMFGLADDLYDGAIAHIVEEEERFIFYIEFAGRTPKTRRTEVAEFVTRANWGILIGNFELDFEDGSVRYKSSVGYTNSRLTKALVRNAIGAARDACEAFGPALHSVMDGTKSVAAALKETESGAE